MALFVYGVTNACSQPLGSLPVLYDCWKNLGDDGSYLLCSFFKDSGWEFIWACSFVLV